MRTDRALGGFNKLDIVEVFRSRDRLQKIGDSSGYRPQDRFIVTLPPLSLRSVSQRLRGWSWIDFPSRAQGHSFSG